MIYQIILVFLSRPLVSDCEWTLQWNDEFEHDRLNFQSKMWDIEDSGNRCKEPFSSQLNCMTARDENVRTVDGALAITALLQDKITPGYKKPFTSAYIYSAEYFNQGKFEVRAAMPMGKILRAQINLYEPQENDNTWFGIALVDFKQTTSFEVGVWEYGGNFSKYFSYEPGVNLSDFHVYTLEREAQHLLWYFDGFNYFNFSIDLLDERLRERLNAGMEIDINLVVGGPKMSNNWTNETVDDWKCSSLIVDYVRFFESSEEADNEIPDANNTDKSPDSICRSVKMLRFQNSTGSIKQEESEINKHSSIYFIFYVIPIIIILVLIIGILIWKLKQHRKQTERLDEQGKLEFDAKKEENFYSVISEGEYDNFIEANMYEPVNENINDGHYLEVYADVKDNSQNDEQPRYEKMSKSPKVQHLQMSESNEYF